MARLSRNGVNSLSRPGQTQLKATTVRFRRWAKHVALFGPIDPLVAWIALKVDRATASVQPRETGDYRVALPNGLKMTVPKESPSAPLFAAGLYEPDVTALLEQHLTAGMTLVDVGAHVGYYSLLASTLVGPTGRVYAFEPDSSIYAYLESNARNNQCQNIVCIKQAVSHTVGYARFIRPEAERGFLASPSLEDGPNVRGPLEGSLKFESVPTTTLDQYFAGHAWPQIDLIKMDIEGAESAALEGMRQLSARTPKLKLLFEFNLGAMERAGSGPHELIGTLRGIGFRTAYVVEKGLNRYPLTDGLFPVSRLIYNVLVTKE
jgi:FkbM family methyltransferase